MEKSTRTYLVNKYNRISQKTSATCLKYHYVYNTIHVNIYFDAWDRKSVSLSIVLVSTEAKKYYYTPLNILNSTMRTEYLPKIPSQILEKILVNEHLDDFYNKMEEHLLKDQPHINYYNQDKYFVNTIKYTKNKLDLPFWWYIRNIRMTDETVENLSARADITRDVLKKVQEKGLTLVRTSGPTKRKELTLILQQQGIELI